MIPAALVAENRWVCWRLLVRKGKQTKVPFVAAPGTQLAKSNDPATWRPYEDAVRFAPRFNGIGYALGDGWAGIDLDNCRDPNTGEIATWAHAIVELMDSYTEVSPSKTGLHILCRGAWPKGWNNRRGVIGGKKVGIEAYGEGKYFTVTGEVVRDTGIEERDAQLAELATREMVFDSPRLRATVETRGTTTDDELLRRMFASANGEKIKRLWDGDLADHAGDDSAGDWQLLDDLLYWTEGDTARTERLMRRSALVRDKWDAPHFTGGEPYLAGSLRKRFARWKQKHSATTETPAPTAESEEPTDEPRLLRDLMAKTLEAPVHPVPGLFQQGLMVFAGKPKSGKSWLVLNVTLAVASGGVALGKVECARHDVLYLALEDPEWRLQDRVRKVLGDGSEIPEGFYYHVKWRHLDRGGLADLDEWLGKHPSVRLVVIDVWKRVKPRPQKGENAYDADYDMAAPLKALADAHRCAIVIVHHQNKLQVEDYVDSISGSLGLAAAADGHIVLVRKRGPNSKNKRTFMGTGRDVAEFEWALSWDDALWCYQIVGENEEVQEASELEETRRLIREAERPVRPGEFATMANITLSAAKSRLWRYAASGDLRRLGDGAYYLAIAGGVLPAITATVQPVAPVADGAAVAEVSPVAANTNNGQFPAWDGHARKCRTCAGWLRGTEEDYCRKCIEAGNDVTTEQI